MTKVFVIIILPVVKCLLLSDQSRDRLTNQVVKFERDIDNLESQIAK